MGFRFHCENCNVSFCSACEQLGSHDMQHQLTRTVPSLEVCAPIKMNHQEFHSFLCDKINVFGDRLFAGLNGRLIACSPLSVFHALLILANGSDGNTQSQILNSLGLSGMDLHDINAASNEVLTSFHASDEVCVLNSIFGNRQYGLRFQPQFLSTCCDCYHAFAGLVTTIDEVNDWCKNLTGGSVLCGMNDLPHFKRISIFSATHICAAWETPFLAGFSRPHAFRMSYSAEVIADMMIAYGNFSFCSSLAFDAVRLPLQADPDLDVVVILPKRDAEFPEWSGVWKGVQCQAVYGSLCIPKFKTDFHIDLHTALPSLGINKAFDDLNGDMHPM